MPGGLCEHRYGNPPLPKDSRILYGACGHRAVPDLGVSGALAVRVLSWAIVLSIAACGDGGTTDPDSNPDADPESPIVPVKGEWYRPAVAATWQWQLLGAINTAYDVDLYDIDLFDTSETLIASLQASGKRVLCYFSAGSFEDFRSDAASFPSQVLGNALDDFPNERWLDIRSSSVLTIMEARLDMAVAKGCDGVEPDNMAGFDNNSGFSLTSADQLTFNRTIANEAHERGLSVGLKNDLDQVSDLIAFFDFQVNEQCHEFDECANLDAFITAGKPVFNAEYELPLVSDAGARDRLCQAALARNFRTLILPFDLDDSFRFSCDP